MLFADLVGIDAVLLLAQAATTSLGVHLAGCDHALVLANAAVVAVAIVANLSFEAIGADLVIVAAVGALALVLMTRCGRER